jgi:hypothetical protein
MWSLPFRQRGARAIAGNELGRIVETPKLLPTLEQELLEIIKTRHACA